MISILLAGAAASAMSLVGVLLTSQRLQSTIHRWLHFLPSATAGVFAVIIFSLVEEASHDLSYLELSIAAVGGFALAGAIGLFAPERVECHGDACETRIPARARRIFAADGFHNAIDGIALVGAFASGAPLGWSVAAGVVIHELVQELSEFFVYLESGMSIRQAITYNFLTSLSVFLGIGAGLLLTSMGEQISALLAGVAMGSFAFVVVRDLLPHTFHKGDTRDLFIHIIAAVAGMGLMIATNTLAHLH